MSIRTCDMGPARLSTMGKKINSSSVGSYLSLSAATRRPESFRSRERHAIACHSTNAPHKDTGSDINQEIFTVFVDDPVRRTAAA